MSRLTLSTITERLDEHLDDLWRRYAQGRVEDLHGKLVYRLMVKCKLPLQFIGDGAFRETYRILGTPYVIKIPSGSSGSYVQHARADLNAYDLIQGTRKMSKLRKYLPEIHYRNYAIGVIVTDYVRPLTRTYDSHRAFTYYGPYREEILRVADLVTKHSKADDGDLDLQKMDNFGYVKGELKILDLGCFTGESC